MTHGFTDVLFALITCEQFKETMRRTANLSIILKKIVRFNTILE